MKTRFLLSMAVAGMLSAPFAFAENRDHHGDGHKGDRHKGKYAAKMIEKMDSDSDGKVSVDEFMEAHKVKFAKMDADKDGLLTKDEIKAYKMKKREKRERHEENMERMIERHEKEDAL